MTGTEEQKKKTPEEEGFEPVEFVPVEKPDVQIGPDYFVWIEGAVVLVILALVILEEIEPLYEFGRAVWRLFK